MGALGKLAKVSTAVFVTIALLIGACSCSASTHTTNKNANKNSSTVSASASSASTNSNKTNSAKSTSTIPDYAISWEEADSHIGETVTIYGKVVSTKYASSANGKPTYLDIGASYKSGNGCSVVIWSEDRSAFSGKPESTYSGKTICVTGSLYLYNGHPYIKVTSPSQIDIM